MKNVINKNISSSNNVNKFIKNNNEIKDKKQDLKNYRLTNVHNVINQNLNEIRNVNINGSGKILS